MDPVLVVQILCKPWNNVGGSSEGSECTLRVGKAAGYSECVPALSMEWIITPCKVEDTQYSQLALRWDWPLKGRCKDSIGEAALMGWTFARDKSLFNFLRTGAHVLGHMPNLLPCPNNYSFYMPIMPALGWPVTEDGKFSLQQVQSLQRLGHFCLLVLALWWLYLVI